MFVGALMRDATGTTYFTPDELNRLGRIDYSGGKMINYEYHPTGTLKSIKTAVGVPMVEIFRWQPCTRL